MARSYQIKDKFRKFQAGWLAGCAAHRNKTGIHGLPKDQTAINAVKGGRTLQSLMQIPEYCQLHRDKIRYGKIKRKFNILFFLEN